MNYSAWDTSGPSSIGKEFYGIKAVRASTAVASPIRSEKQKRKVQRNENQAVRQSSFDLPAMYEFRKKGHTWAECGEQFGCSMSNARKRILKKYPDAVGYGTKNAHHKVDSVVLVRLLDMGHSYRMIAKAVRLPLSSVRDRIVNHRNNKQVTTLTAPLTVDSDRPLSMKPRICLSSPEMRTQQ